uniref:Uncharacterized protein n=1 Tax=Lactuca sativa TaxID=4236 RepID=A0A9R1XSX4_LACSA|nr:hypothetical protein LSAT_V11C300112470 [Lactuca sativa]
MVDSLYSSLEEGTSKASKITSFGDLDFRLFALGSDQDVHHLGIYVGNYKLIDVYTEHGKTNLQTYSMSPNPSKDRIVELKSHQVAPKGCSWSSMTLQIIMRVFQT